MKRATVFRRHSYRVFLSLLAMLFVGRAFAAEGLLIDHNCTTIDKIPAAALTKARQEFRVAYGHTSHGSQVVSGMNALRARDGGRYGYSNRGDDGALSLWDSTPGGDLGNPDRVTWAQRTRELLQGRGSDRNLVMWSWCGQVSSASADDIKTYLELMSQLEREFPKVTFVYMTGHLDGGGAAGNLHQRNEQIRAFCRINKKVLFDFADIESYDPDGKVNYMELMASDSCDYRDDKARGNWAAAWLARNPGHNYALPDSAAHSHPLNGALKGQAFWHMLARLAGWNGK